jgi:fermentation-respiration switch protein FrsA (DUF1100 family)
MPPSPPRLLFSLSAILMTSRVPNHSGDSDELVPPSHMKKLSELASKSRNLDFYSVSGGGHNDTFGNLLQINEFIAALISTILLV